MKRGVRVILLPENRCPTVEYMQVDIKFKIQYLIKQRNFTHAIQPTEKDNNYYCAVLFITLK